MSKISMVVLILFLAAPVWGDIDFDGVDDHLTCGSDASIDDIFAGGGTYSAWIFADGYPASNLAYIMNKQPSGSGHRLFWVNENTAGDDRLLLSVEATGDNGSWECHGDLSEGVWYHVAVTYDSDALSNDAILYINGSTCTIDFDRNPTGAINSDAALDFIIGGRATSDTRNWNGKIKNACIWTSILTAPQIKQIADAKKKNIEIQMQPSNFVDCWLLDDEPDGTSGDGDTFVSTTRINNCTGVDGPNNTGLTAQAESMLTY